MNELDQKKPSMMMDLLEQLDSLTGQANEQAHMYRSVLRTLDQQTVSWEEPQPQSEGDCEPMQTPDSHISKLSVMIDSLRNTVNKNNEILERLNKIV